MTGEWCRTSTTGPGGRCTKLGGGKFNQTMDPGSPSSILPGKPLGAFLAKAKQGEQTKEKQVHKAKWKRSTSQKRSGRTSHLCAGKWGSSTDTSSRPWQFWPSTVALWEICQYQKTTEPLICKLQFQWLIQKIMHEIWFEIRFLGIATRALQEATKAYLIGLFEDTNMCVIHTKRVNILLQDMQLTQRIWGN